MASVLGIKLATLAALLSDLARAGLLPLEAADGSSLVSDDVTSSADPAATRTVR